MSYRTYVNDYQIFGNNDYYSEWIEFIKSEGVAVDNECCYSGTIKNVMGAVETIEKIILRIEEERRERIREFENHLKGGEDERISRFKPTSIFDFRRSYNDFMKEQESRPGDKFNDSITDKMMEVRNNGYVFMSCAFLEACGDSIERDEPFAVAQHFNCFKLKDGCEIKVEAR